MWDITAFTVEPGVPLSVGYMFSHSPLWGLRSTCMIACKRKIIPRLVFIYLCSGGSAVSCKCETLAWLGWHYGVLWGLCCPKIESGRIQIHLIWQLWQFHGEVWISLLGKIDFFALMTWMTTPGLSCILVVLCPGICSWRLFMWVMYTIFTSFHNDWYWWCWRFLWLCWECF